jgi:ABC-2 type transport system ATP-binding protein
MLDIRDISVSYGTHRIFTNLSATFTKGAVHGIVGSNGAGKTTLLKTLAGIIPMQSGTITLDGKPLTAEEYALLEIEPFFYPRITGSEYLRLFQFKNPNFNGEAWNRLFALPLEDEIATYSAGMKKKLALLGIIGVKPRVMLLDEPLNSLDFDTSYVLMDTLRLLAANGMTVLISSHIVEPLISVCDTITWIAGAQDIRHFDSPEFPTLAARLRPQGHEVQIALVKRLLNDSSHEESETL